MRPSWLRPPSLLLLLLGRFTHKLRKMSLRRYAYLDPQHPAVADLPPIVHDEFHTLYPLDEAAVSKTLGLSTCHFKAMSMKDASVVALRRIYNTPCACTNTRPGTGLVRGS